MADPPEETPQPTPREPPAETTEQASEERRSWRGLVPRRRRPDEPIDNGDAPPEEPTEVIPAPPRPDGPARLRRERKRLLSEREDAVYNLGGLAFELYRRDRLGEEVMQRRAGEVAMLDDSVRDIDARLGEIDRDRRERRRRGPDDGVVGCCLACRAPFRAEARFCWQCGAQLVSGGGGDEQVTAVITPGPAPDPPTAPEEP